MKFKETGGHGVLLFEDDLQKYPQEVGRYLPPAVIGSSLKQNDWTDANYFRASFKES